MFTNKKQEGMKEKKEEIMSLSEIENDLTPAKTKDWVNGESGELIRLVDLQHTKSKLVGMKKKYSSLKITKENYKKEGADAEKILRQTRCLLQNIHKKNNKYLNDTKNEEKKMFDELILEIEPVEKRLKSEISIIENSVKFEKEEKEKAEEKRKKEIEDNLSEWDINLGKMLSSIKNEEQLEVFDKTLSELKDRFPAFEEFEFKAKRIYAVFSGRRSEAVNFIDEVKKLAEDKKKIEEQKEELASKREKILDFRANQLSKRGFIFSGSERISFIREGSLLKIDVEKVLSLDEVDWTVELDRIDLEIKLFEENKSKEVEKSVSDIKEQWKDLVEVFKGFGGVMSTKLKGNHIPTKEDIDNLKKATEEIHKKKKAQKMKEVKTEIEPWQSEFLKFIAGFEKRVKSSKFVNNESEAIMYNLINRFEEVINEVLGEFN